MHLIFDIEVFLSIADRSLINRQNQVSFLVYRQGNKRKVGRSVGKIKIKLFNFQSWYFFKNNILHSKHRRKPRNLYIVYYNNDKCFLLLVTYISLLYFFFFFFQKAENHRLKKASWPKFIILIFCSIGSVDQQINLVSP